MKTTVVRSRSSRGQGHPKPAVPAAKPAALKSLIHKHCSRYSRLSRFIDDLNVGLCARGYAYRYRGLARQPAEPAEPAGIVSSQRFKGSRVVAAPRATCWPYQPYIIAPAHSSPATVDRAPRPQQNYNTQSTPARCSDGEMLQCGCSALDCRSYLRGN
jgi:hypothetical protein